jgi:hypothetical protein
MAANAQAICNSFKQDLLDGLHAFGASVIRGATTKDTFYGALYLVNQSYGAGTTAYSASGEVSSANYTAGGQAITNANAPALDGTTAIWTPSASLAWTTVTFASFDTMLVYNNTASGKNAVAVYTFGAQTITAGNFTLTMPTNAAATALLQLA